MSVSKSSSHQTSVTRNSDSDSQGSTTSQPGDAFSTSETVLRGLWSLVYFGTTPLLGGGLLSFFDSYYKVHKLQNSFKKGEFSGELIYKARLKRAYHELYIATASYIPLPILFGLMCAKPEYFDLATLKAQWDFDGYSKEGLRDILDSISQHTGVENVDAFMVVLCFAFVYFWLARSIGNYCSSTNVLAYIDDNYEKRYPDSSSHPSKASTEEDSDEEETPRIIKKQSTTSAPTNTLFQNEVKAFAENLKKMSSCGKEALMFTFFGLNPKWHGTPDENTLPTYSSAKPNEHTQQQVSDFQLAENIKNLSNLR